jgi:hypothetical protein
LASRIEISSDGLNLYATAAAVTAVPMYMTAIVLGKTASVNAMCTTRGVPWNRILETKTLVAAVIKRLMKRAEWGMATWRNKRISAEVKVKGTSKKKI